MSSPDLLRTACVEVLDARARRPILGGLRHYQKQLQNADRIVIIACGTSWHAGLVAGYLFEEFARNPLEVEYSAELRDRTPVIEEGNFVIAISQSGEPTDTLAAVESAKFRGQRSSEFVT